MLKLLLYTSVSNLALEYSENEPLHCWTKPDLTILDEIQIEVPYSAVYEFTGYDRVTLYPKHNW